MSGSAKRRTLPVVRWLQVGAAVAGIGIALAAVPGTAMADEGDAPSTADSSVSSSSDPAASEPSTQHDADADEETAATDEDEPEVVDGGESAVVEEVEIPWEPTKSDDSDVDVPPKAEPPAEETATEDLSDDRGRSGGHDADAVKEEDDAPERDDESETTAVSSEDTSEAEAAPTTSAPEVVTTAAAAARTVTTLAAPTQPSCGCDKPDTFFKAISVAVDQFLTGTANWLSSLPDNPFTSFFEGAVYLVRRVLFPASVGVIARPVEVPLIFTPTTTDSGATKLGIYVTIGNGTTPQLFEFDTGSAGLYAAYASAAPGESPWWGTNVESQDTSIHVAFDSGLVYNGTAVTTAVSLFASPDSCTALVNTGQLTVGQMNQIGTSTSAEAFWGPDGSTVGGPPVEGAFYGDFGMGLTYQPNGVMNVISQLSFGWGVKPGFRVHVDPVTNEAWVQIGLTRADLQNPDGMYFAMEPDKAAPKGATVPNSGADYYDKYLFKATINMADSEGRLVVSDPNRGMLPDTGASTTLHNTQKSTSKKEYRKHLVDWSEEFTTGKLYSGLTFSLSATTTDGTQVSFFEFETTESVDGGRVGVQNATSPPSDEDKTKKTPYYLNTGISLFNEYDVVYSLGTSQGGGTLGLIEQGIQAAERPRRR